MAAHVPSRRSGLEVSIDVRLRPETGHDSCVSRISSIVEIVEAMHMADPSDYLLHAFAGDTAALDSLLRSLKEDCGAAQAQTRIAMR